MKSTYLALAALALLMVPIAGEAAPSPTFIPLAADADEGLIVPADSPMKFVHFDKEGGAHFSGRFVLSGLFAYGCEVECQGKITEDYLVLTIVPDPEVAARLPRWKVHDNDIKIYLTREAPLARAIATPKQKAALLSGKLPEIRGHIAVVVDDFQTAIECDSASYSARFVAIAKPPKRETKAPDGNYGCP